MTSPGVGRIVVSSEALARQLPVCTVLMTMKLKGKSEPVSRRDGGGGSESRSQGQERHIALNIFFWWHQRLLPRKLHDPPSATPHFFTCAVASVSNPQELHPHGAPHGTREHPIGKSWCSH